MCPAQPPTMRSPCPRVPFNPAAPFHSPLQEDKFWDFTPIFTEIKSQLAAEQAEQVRTARAGQRGRC